MNIKDKFLDLTSKTYPHGYEEELLDKLPENLNKDAHGNYYIKIGDSPSTMFTCHLDTASRDSVNVVHRLNKNIISTDGRSILGADDKAGVVILMYLIERNIQGLYYFFIGEERGCVGSRKLAQDHKINPIQNINKVVSFDRRGTDSVITHQLGGRCCSDLFANYLAKELNKYEPTFHYETDPTGIYTDSAQFTEIYSECTNISVGYNHEHTSSEYQDILHLENLCKAVSKIDWNNIPTSRDPKKNTGYDEYEDDYYEYGYSKNYKTYDNKDKTDNTYRTTFYFTDQVYNYNSSITLSRNPNKIIDIDLHDDRLDLEYQKIKELFNSFEVEHDEIVWDGHRLHITYNPTHSSTMYREELSEYIDILDFWKVECGEKL